MRLSLVLLLALSAPAAAFPSAQVSTAGLPGDHRAGLDDDGDTIPDSDDWCAQTPAGARVGSDGCAPGEVPVGCSTRPLQPVAKPAAVPVPSVSPPAPAAPPKDNDGDGVADDADQCAGTPAGLAVDAKGCVQIEKVVLSGVSFAMGSSRLLPEASTTLQTVAAAMKANPQVTVEIGGHTDSVGAASRNQRLSERRANAVKAFLEGEGIEPARLTAVGYGEAEPLDSNETPEGRANNRRVAFKVTHD